MTKKNNNLNEQEIKQEQTTVEEEQVVGVEEVIEDDVKESKAKRFVNYCKAHKKQIGLVIAGIACTAAGYALGVKVDTSDDDILPALEDHSDEQYISDDSVIDVEAVSEEETEK